MFSAAALRLPHTFDSEQQVARRVDELIELMGLGLYRNSFVRELSTGTRRVLDLACQVAHRPTVILLDEPSSGIAQREVEALAPVLLRLRDEMGASLVVIEHDMPLISSISDRLVALDQGRVIAIGPSGRRARASRRGRELSRDVELRRSLDLVQNSNKGVSQMQPASAGGGDGSKENSTR